MRFAEVMLNYAETANETGKIEEAREILLSCSRQHHKKDL